MNRVGRVTARVVLATAAMAFLAAPAQADSYEFQFAVRGDLWAHADAYSGNTYGDVSYEDDGDEIYVHDTQKDGMRVAAFWSVPALNRTGLCVNKAGNESLLECDKSFAEGHRIYIRFAGRCNGSVSPCNRLSHFSNGSSTDSTDT